MKKNKWSKIRSCETTVKGQQNNLYMFSLYFILIRPLHLVHLVLSSGVCMAKIWRSSGLLHPAVPAQPDVHKQSKRVNQELKSHLLKEKKSFTIHKTRKNKNFCMFMVTLLYVCIVTALATKTNSSLSLQLLANQTVNSTVKTLLTDVETFQYFRTFFLINCFGLCCTLTNMAKIIDSSFEQGIRRKHTNKILEP